VVGGRRRRGTADAGVDAAVTAALPKEFLQAPGLSVEETLEAAPPRDARRGVTAPPDLVFDVDLKPGESSVVALRHPSGAITFHTSFERSVGPAAPVAARSSRSTPSTRSKRRGAAAATGTGASAGAGVAQFRIPIRRVGGDVAPSASDGVGRRRGLVTKAIKVIVIKVAKTAADAVVSFALPRLARLWEERSWEKEGLAEGWFRVTPDAASPKGLRLTAAVPAAGQRTLLFVHGTFSDAASGFGDLAQTDFFERVRPIYGTRIYAYNHFSVSRTPDENAGLMLSALPAGDYSFDAITHSRGGLVLRSAIEHRAMHGAAANRFTLGHAVLVASPNEGTPLATPARWEDTVGWFANLLDFFPSTPFTTGASFVSEALVWLASHAGKDLPGLRAMDGAGPLVADLQAPPGPPASAYSALVSNVHPDESLFQRALDVGVDSFFGTANDLVVPSEGGWRIDRDGSPYIPASRIGCFGPGGNITTSAGSDPITHISFFDRAETAEFLVRALARQPHALPAIDPGVPLPDRRFPNVLRAIARRSVLTSTSDTLISDTLTPDTLTSNSGADDVVTAGNPQAAAGRGRVSLRRFEEDIDTFHIVILDEFDPEAELEKDMPASAKKRKAATSEGEDADEESVAGREKERPRFARVFATYAGARVTASMRLRRDKRKGEPPTRYGKIIGTHERIKNYTNRVEGSLPTDDEMMEFGRDLFETLFIGDVRRLYDEARARQRGRKLDLVLTSMISWIAEKPWEFAYDSSRQSFLATEEIHFVRNVLTAVPADMIEPCRGPLKILVASAQPVGFGHLSIEQELEVVRRGFEPLIEAGLVAVEVLPRATPAAIHGRLSTGEYTIVHFIGHGEFDETTEEGFLVFEDTRGGAFRLGERSIREIFCKRGVSLVFLNACQSGSGGRADFNKGIAQALVSHGLPALVANQYSVLDSSATSFAQHFYWSLAQGMTLGEAAREARIAVNYSMQGELIDWAVPVLYARDHNKALCAKPDRVTPITTTAVRATSRRATAGRPQRVAVWDIDNVFPSLDRTLDRMNASQRVFGFELVDMSAPLDAWDLETRADDGTPYLWAERVAKRLQSKTVELRVNLLVCVTRHWLRDDEWLNLYGWWPEGRKWQVVIFSCAGLPELTAEGPDTDRAIANAMVTALAGYYGNADSHERGAKDCPLAFNKDRTIEHITGVQKFDAGCRRKLVKTLPTELPALEELLKTFV
jgi:hypothetical protein